MAGSKILRGSFLLIIGNIIFRIGGYVYRVLMSRMLGPEGYGLLGLTFPFQGMFQILSAGGLPPAIAKYVAEYNAKDDKQMARQVIITSTKFMVVMAIILSIILLFSSDWIANVIFNKPEVVWCLRAVCLITPFSVVVGALRGAFQALYKAEYIVYNRMIEQVFIVCFAVIFVSLGFYSVGGVLGTAGGFVASAISAILIYRHYIVPMLGKYDDSFLSFHEELKLIVTLLRFAIPVAITALSEIAIYDIGTLIIGVFMLTSDVGYYTAADPISRIPLIISLSVSTILLPAVAEAHTLHNEKLLQRYILDCIRYSIIVVLPLCVGISIFAMPLLVLLFGTSYIPSSGVLSILVIGMAFYTVFMIACSILQGIGLPRLPMYILVSGTIVNLLLNVLLVQFFGIIGAAIGTSIATLFLMIIIVLLLIKVTGVKLPLKNIAFIVLANICMGVVCFLIPNTILGMFVGSVLGCIVYIICLILFKVFNRNDLKFIQSYSSKFKYFKCFIDKLVKIIEDHNLIYD
ncbi:MAG: oligosaccharide flippase family protein [Methanobacteriaceae archaeon]|nr:oligosaccharide flippase family protein [Methanobacteriaceae archaeon]